MDDLTGSDTALVIIDVQNGFLSPHTRRVLPTIHRLIDSNPQLIIATQFYNPPGSPFRTYMQWERMGTPEEVALDPKVQSAADVIIPKSTYIAEPLVTALREKGLSKALVVGIDTDVCVLHNCAHLFDRGIEVHVDLSGCATTGGQAADKAAAALLGRTVGRQYVHSAVRLL